MADLLSILRNINPASVEALEPDPRIPEEMWLNPTGYTGIKDLGISGFTSPVLGDSVFVDKEAPRQFRNRTHEAAHGMQNQSPFPATKEQDRVSTSTKDKIPMSEQTTWNEQWKHNSDLSASEWMGKLARIAPKISKIYPEIGGYLSYDHLSTQGSNPFGLQETMAALHEHERTMSQKDPRYDITTDPTFAGVFDDKTKQAFRAMTGLRNIRTDPKDPPASQVTNQNWYQR